MLYVPTLLRWYGLARTPQTGLLVCRFPPSGTPTYVTALFVFGSDPVCNATEMLVTEFLPSNALHWCLITTSFMVLSETCNGRKTDVHVQKIDGKILVFSRSLWLLGQGVQVAPADVG